MNRLGVWIISFVMLWLLAACSSAPRRNDPADKVGVTTSGIREAAEARLAALSRGDIDGYLAPYSESAVWLPPDSGSIAGKAAARQMLAKVLQDVNLDMAAEVDEELVLSSDWVMERGTYVSTQRSKKGGNATTTVGSFLTLWNREADGAWRIAYDVWNMDRAEEER